VTPRGEMGRKVRTCGPRQPTRESPIRGKKKKKKKQKKNTPFRGRKKKRNERINIIEREKGQGGHTLKRRTKQLQK